MLVRDAMAGDLRSELYDRYVSAFKGERGATSDSQLAWWDYRYLPLFDGLARDAAVLEIGCGDGALLAYLARRGFSRASGVDISAEQVELAHRRGVAVEHRDALDLLADRPNAYAAVVAVDVFEHFTRQEASRAAQVIFGALHSGGRLIVQTANGAGLFPGQVIYGDLTHVTIFTPQSLTQLLRPAGFVDLSFAETGPVPWRLRGRLDAGLWKLITTVATTVRVVETGKRQSIWTENFLCRAFKP
jgi:2-polyprenyl-3-methyl-5-hydroxy-6-metoxy-1,4-benzoquinol methylase